MTPFFGARTTSFALGMIVLAGSAHANAQSRDADDVYDNDSSDAAKESFEKGVSLAKAGKAAESLAAFQKAYETRPTWKILYNIGTSAESAGDPATSLRAFQRYLVEGRDIPKTRRAEVEREMKQLEGRVGRVEITAGPGFTISMDGTPAGKTPLDAPLIANPGVHSIRATKDGSTPFVGEALVPKGGTVKIAVDAEPARIASRGADPVRPQSAPTDLSPKRDASPPSSRSTWIAVGWIATGTFAVGAGVMGTLALTTSKSLASSSYQGANPPSDLQSKASRVDTFATVTDVLGGAAAVAAAVSIYLMASAPSNRSHVSAASTRSNRFNPTVDVGPRGLLIRGSF